MGRKWGEESRSWMGLENPQLDPLPNDCHIARGYGPFFRQAYPYRSSSAESGLMFLAFARRHEEINTALRRMAGSLLFL